MSSRDSKNKNKKIYRFHLFFYCLSIYYRYFNPFLCILGEGMRRCGVAFFFFFLLKRNNKE